MFSEKELWRIVGAEQDDKVDMFIGSVGSSLDAGTGIMCTTFSPPHPHPWYLFTEPLYYGQQCCMSETQNQIEKTLSLPPATYLLLAKWHMFFLGLACLIMCSWTLARAPWDASDTVWEMLHSEQSLSEIHNVQFCRQVSGKPSIKKPVIFIYSAFLQCI